MATSIQDVAREAGVSISTVSRSFTRPDLVSAKTRERVLAIADKLNFSLSRSAAALKSGRSLRIAVLMSGHIRLWFTASVIEGLNEVLHTQGYDISVFQISSIEERKEFFEMLPVRRNADAVIVASFDIDNNEIAQLASVGVPIVGINSVEPEARGFTAAVNIDDVQGSTLAARHLINLGHRRITYKNEERHRLHEKMEREGSASADITLRTSIRMSDEAFAAALEKAKAEGRDAVHVRAWLALPAACPSQSHITLDRFTETPGHIAAEDAPQRTVCWEADLTENRTFGAEYSYRETAVYADPLSFTPDAEQPDLYTGEEAPHIVFTPYLRALAAQLTEGIASPAEKAKRIYDYVTLNVRYHFQPSYFVHESIAENCARSRRGDCGIMALTFITLCRIAGIPARWESGFAVAPGDAGCHDWARFYVAPKGWMYADCSYGASMARRGDEVLRRHYFGSLDTGRMVANSAFEAPFDPPMLGFRSDPYDNQSGGMEADGVGLYGDDTVTTKEVLKFEEVE